MFDEIEPYGENFHFSNWAVFLERQAATNGMLMSRVAQKMHAGLVKQKKIPPAGSGPSERVRQECLTSRVVVAEARGSSGGVAGPPVCNSWHMTCPR